MVVNEGIGDHHIPHARDGTSPCGSLEARTASVRPGQVRGMTDKVAGGKKSIAHARPTGGRAFTAWVGRWWAPAERPFGPERALA
jgi:hypothetical protein